jgi:prepilin-type N-terminal cleavage/methylation domain-containing protein
VRSKNKGFTLIEMIIAIGMLAALAVGIIRLFIASQVSLQKAADMDYAVLEINALIEGFQNIGSNSENASRFTIYYDDKWERSAIKDSTAQYAIYGNFAKLSDDKAGLLHLDLRAVRLKPYPLGKNEEYEIYKVAVIIEDMSYWGENK